MAIKKFLEVSTNRRTGGHYLADVGKNGGLVCIGSVRLHSREGIAVKMRGFAAKKKLEAKSS
ncbi:MAG: hypothetical protein WC378_13595 [Opitutaceae bacterium]